MVPSDLCFLEALVLARSGREGTNSCKYQVINTLGTNEPVVESQVLVCVWCATVWKALAIMRGVKFDLTLKQDFQVIKT